MRILFGRKFLLQEPAKWFSHDTFRVGCNGENKECTKKLSNGIIVIGQEDEHMLIACKSQISGKCYGKKHELLDFR